MSTAISRLAAQYPWTKSPLIIGAPMRVLSGPHLATAVSAAGGLGFIGPGAKTEDLRPDLASASKLTDNLARSSLLPVGVGFQLWNDNLKIAAELIQEHKPCAVWFYAPHEVKEFDAWSAEIRKASADTAIWIQIGTLLEVKRLLDLEHVPDVIVVQGAEAGGHGRANDGLGLFTLLPEVIELLQERKLDIPVIAAGGIVDGRGAVAALSLGAHGVAMGTRFLASSEARISKGYQQEIVRATDGGASTAKTMLYNHLRGTFGWPKEYSPRTIVNKSYHEHKAGVAFEQLKERHDEAAKGEDGWGPEGRLATYASASIGLIKAVQPAAEIVESTRRQILDLTTSLHRSIGKARL